MVAEMTDKNNTGPPPGHGSAHAPIVDWRPPRALASSDRPLDLRQMSGPNPLTAERGGMTLAT